MGRKLTLTLVLMLIAAIANCDSNGNNFKNLKSDMLSTHIFEDFMNTYIYGNLGKDPSESYYYSYNNVMSLLNEIRTQFPEISRIESIGQTYEKREMHLLTLGLDIEANEVGAKADLPPSMLFTSVHHAREVMSVAMEVYVMLSLLHKYTHNDTSTQSLLKLHNIHFLPMVNVDGYYKIFETFDQTSTYPFYRKNRHDEKGCSDLTLGVDLNRNYGHKFAYDNRGSSGRKCAEDYRGQSAFSEPETQNIRDLIQSSNKNIKIALNMHSWGNLFIIPYNYDNQWNKDMVDSDIYKMYLDIRDSGLLPKGDLFGNGKQTIRYTANGDATDWMATQNGIISISPELGTTDHHTDKFFPDKQYIFPIISQNYPWINYTMFKLSSEVEASISKFTKASISSADSYQYFDIEVTVQNFGFSQAKNLLVNVKATEPLQIYSIDNRDATNVHSDRLTHSKLDSLDMATWQIVGRIKKDKWDTMQQESVFDLKSNTVFTVTTDKYPHISSLQKSTRSLSSLDLVDAEFQGGNIDGSGQNRIWYFVIAAILVIGCIALGVYFYFKHNSKPRMIKLQEDNEVLEMSQNLDQNDKKISMG